jgi:hypothetical protein
MKVLRNAVLALLLLLLAILAGLTILERTHSRSGLEKRGSQVSVRPDSHSSQVESSGLNELPSADDHSQRENAASASSPAPATHDSAASLMVRVLGKVDQSPISQVRVLLFPRPSPPEWNVSDASGTKGDLHNAPITDKMGEVEFEVPASTDLNLEADPEDESVGSAQVSVPALSAGEQRAIVVQLPQGNDGHLFGKVIDALSGGSIAGARVRLIDGREKQPGSSGWTRDVLLTEKTDPEGEFELRFPTWRRPSIRVEAQEYGVGLSGSATGHETREDALIIKLTKSATFEVHAFDSMGRALAGVLLTMSARGFEIGMQQGRAQEFHGPEDWNLPDERWQARTGPDGVAVIKDLPTGVPITAELRKGDAVLRHEPDPITLAPGESRSVEWKVGAGTRIDGLVVDQGGTPAAGLEVWLQRTGRTRGYPFSFVTELQIQARAKTDGAGRFALEDVPPGQWGIGPAFEVDVSTGEIHGDVAPFAEVFTLSGEPHRDLTLQVSRGLYIRGRVLDPDGNGAASGYVQPEFSEVQPELSVRTSSDGSFSLGPLMPGTVTLVANGEGFAPSDEVSASAGTSGIVLHLKPGSRIHGRVVDGGTGEGCQAQIMYWPEQPGPGPRGRGWASSSEADGTFQASGLAQGRYAVTARSEDGRFAQQVGIDIASGAESGDVLLQLTRGARIRVTYRGSQPSALVLVRCQGALVSPGSSIANGVSKELPVPAGPIVIEVQSMQEKLLRTMAVELRAGETKDVVVTDY